MFLFLGLKRKKKHYQPLTTNGWFNFLLWVFDICGRLCKHAHSFKPDDQKTIYEKFLLLVSFFCGNSKQLFKEKHKMPFKIWICYWKKKSLFSYYILDKMLESHCETPLVAPEPQVADPWPRRILPKCHDLFN